MQLPAQLVAHKQLIQTIAITSGAFLIALPIGAAVLPHNHVAQAQETPPPSAIVRTASSDGQSSCATDTTSTGTSVTAPVTVKKAVIEAVTPTTSAVDNNSVNNSGATAQVDHAVVGVAAADNDVLSHNTVSVPVLNHNNIPVLSNNTTTVNPSVLNNNTILSNNSSNLLGIGSVLGGLDL